MDFILEFAKLIKTTPKLCLPMQECQNSPYNSFLYRSRDCHLCFSSSYLESCLYLDTASHNKDCVDGAFINHCELCYECLHCDSCYNCNFCQDCKNCVDCDFCFECQGCTNCFGCVGLRKKEFYIFNEKYSREEYDQRLAKLKNLPSEKIRAQIETLRQKFPHPAFHGMNCENVNGDYIKNSKNCFVCFHVENAQDCFYCYDEIVDVRDCCDCTHIQNCELCYNLMSASECYNVNSSWWITGSRDCEYCFCVQNSNNCFGCVYTQHKEFHILNKPYSKDAYFKKTAELKDELIKKGLHGKYLVMDAVDLAKTI